MAWNEEYHWLNKPPLGSQLDRTHPIVTANNLLLCCLLNEGGAKGNCNELVSPGQRNGTYTACTTTPGKTGTAIHFDGSTSKIQFGSLGYLPPLCVEFLYRPSVVGSYQGLFDSRPSAAGTMRQSSLSAHGALEWHAADPQPVIFQVGDAPNTTFTHMHANFFIDASNGSKRTVEIYTNGILNSTTVGTTAAASAWTTFCVGNFNNTNWFQGDVEFFRVWGSRLLAGTVSSLVEEPYQMIQPPNHLRWRFPAAAASGGSIYLPASLFGVHA